jgi:hypothetical protein
MARAKSFSDLVALVVDGDVRLLEEELTGPDGARRPGAIAIRVDPDRELGS